MKVINTCKILLTLALLVSARFSLNAQSLTTYVDNSYVGTLSVTIDGTTYAHEGICIEAQKCADETLNLSVKEFTLVRDGEKKPIGNILLKGITLTKDNSQDIVRIASYQTITITTSDISTDTSDGDGNTVSGPDMGWGDSGDGIEGSEDPEWFGPTYGEMQVRTSGGLRHDHADLSFDIYIPSLAKSVRVTFTTADVVTALTTVKCLNTPDTSDAFTPAGLRATSSYRGIIIRRKR